MTTVAQDKRLLRVEDAFRMIDEANWGAPSVAFGPYCKGEYFDSVLHVLANEWSWHRFINSLPWGNGLADSIRRECGVQYYRNAAWTCTYCGHWQAGLHTFAFMHHKPWNTGLVICDMCGCRMYDWEECDYSGTLDPQRLSVKK